MKQIIAVDLKDDNASAVISEAPKPLVVIVGQTASGKSALAMDLARKFNGELVCADAWTVYKGFDIGTAKPSKEDQRQVAHHLLDIADPNDGFSVVEFKKQAVSAIAGIYDRNKQPILVGGSGLYVDSLLYNYSFMPPSNKKNRTELESKSLLELVQLAEQKGYDLTKIDTRNKRRVVRFIENQGKMPSSSVLRPSTLIIGVRRSSSDLEKLVKCRVEKMIAGGLIDEVKELASQYGWDCEPMKGIGYRELRAHLENSQDIDKTKENIIRSSINLAKKQQTWFKRNKSIHWIDDPSDAASIVATFLNTGQ